MLKFYITCLAAACLAAGGAAVIYSEERCYAHLACFLSILLLFAAVSCLCCRRSRKAEIARQERLKKIEALSVLTGSVVHDFSNIITSIRGAAEKLCTKSDNAAETAKYADIIMKACERSSCLTSQLAFCARYDNWPTAVTDINDCVDKTVLLLQDSINERISVSVRTDAKKSYVCGNRNLLESALLNLLFNARDALENREGKIEITTRDVFLKPADVRRCLINANAGDYLEVCVADSGGGISDEVMSKLFEPFFTTKQNGKGNGLGLPVVYAVVLKHEGTLRVETSDKGSSFYLYFPLTDMSKTDKSACVSCDALNAEVLVVEDEKVLRELLSDILKSFGVKVLTAATAEEAEKIYRCAKNIDVVLLDVVMPKKNGIKVFEILKQINPDVKVIFMSGYGQDKGLAEVLAQNGRTDFIRKPYVADECYEKLVGMLAKK